MRRYKEKFDEVIAGRKLTDVIKVRNLGNKNSKKLDDEQERMIKQLYAQPNAPSYSDVYRKVVELGRRKGWWLENGRYNPPSYSEVYRVLKSFENAAAIERYGRAYVENTILPTINRRKLTKRT